MIHIYTGDGKGKTTASLGLVSRFLGYGGKCAIFQFFKNCKTGEYNFFKEKVDFYFPDTDPGLSFEFTDGQKQAEVELFECFKKNTGKYQLIVLDEIVLACNLKIIDENELIDYIKGIKCEVIITGRNASEKLKSIADYVSEIKAVKHPYNDGTTARKGIEF